MTRIKDLKPEQGQSEGATMIEVFKRKIDGLYLVSEDPIILSDEEIGCNDEEERVVDGAETMVNGSNEFPNNTQLEFSDEDESSCADGDIPLLKIPDDISFAEEDDLETKRKSFWESNMNILDVLKEECGSVHSPASSFYENEESSGPVIESTYSLETEDPKKILLDLIKSNSVLSCLLHDDIVDLESSGTVHVDPEVLDDTDNDDTFSIDESTMNIIRRDKRPVLSSSCTVALFKLPASFKPFQSYSTADPILKRWVKFSNRNTNNLKFRRFPCWSTITKTLLPQQLSKLTPEHYFHQAKYVCRNYIHDDSDMDDTSDGSGSDIDLFKDYGSQIVDEEMSYSNNFFSEEGLEEEESEEEDEYEKRTYAIENVSDDTVEDNAEMVPSDPEEVEELCEEKVGWNLNSTERSLKKSVSDKKTPHIEPRKATKHYEYIDSVKGPRSDEVENDNLDFVSSLEIPFEAPTLFRSPRVASKLAQMKNKTVLAHRNYPKRDSSPAVEPSEATPVSKIPGEVTKSESLQQLKDKKISAKTTTKLTRKYTRRTKSTDSAGDDEEGCVDAVKLYIDVMKGVMNDEKPCEAENDVPVEVLSDTVMNSSPTESVGDENPPTPQPEFRASSPVIPSREETTEINLDSGQEPQVCANEDLMSKVSADLIASLKTKVNFEELKETLLTTVLSPVRRKSQLGGEDVQTPSNIESPSQSGSKSNHEEVPAIIHYEDSPASPPDASSVNSALFQQIRDPRIRARMQRLQDELPLEPLGTDKDMSIDSDTSNNFVVIEEPFGSLSMSPVAFVEQGAVEEPEDGEIVPKKKKTKRKDVDEELVYKSPLEQLETEHPSNRYRKLCDSQSEISRVSNREIDIHGSSRYGNYDRSSSDKSRHPERSKHPGHLHKDTDDRYTRDSSKYGSHNYKPDSFDRSHDERFTNSRESRKYLFRDSSGQQTYSSQKYVNDKFRKSSDSTSNNFSNKPGGSCTNYSDHCGPDNFTNRLESPLDPYPTQDPIQQEVSKFLSPDAYSSVPQPYIGSYSEANTEFYNHNHTQDSTVYNTDHHYPRAPVVQPDLTTASNYHYPSQGYAHSTAQYLLHQNNNQDPQQSYQQVQYLQDEFEEYPKTCVSRGQYSHNPRYQDSNKFANSPKSDGERYYKNKTIEKGAFQRFPEKVSIREGSYSSSTSNSFTKTPDSSERYRPGGRNSPNYNKLLYKRHYEDVRARGSRSPRPWDDGRDRTKKHRPRSISRSRSRSRSRSGSPRRRSTSRMRAKTSY